MRGQESLIRNPESRPFALKPSIFPKGQDNGHRLAAPRQLNLLSGFRLIDDSGEVRPRLRDRESFRHTLNVHLYVHHGKPCPYQEVQVVRLTIRIALRALYFVHQHLTPVEWLNPDSRTAPPDTFVDVPDLQRDPHASMSDAAATARQDPALLRRLLRAKDRMDAAPHEDWPVRRLAQVSGASAAHFARAFKEAFGVPPHRYLLARRIERATTLLRDTQLSVTEIAFETGWRSLGTFGRTFRDVTGESPLALRTREQAAGFVLEQVPGCFVSAALRPDLRKAVSEKRRLEQVR
jgi:AraC-like DNA-binding protein